MSASAKVASRWGPSSVRRTRPNVRDRGGGGDDARGELGVGIALERRAFGVDVDADDVRAAREAAARRSDRTFCGVWFGGEGGEV